MDHHDLRLSGAFRLAIKLIKVHMRLIHKTQKFINKDPSKDHERSLEAYRHYLRMIKVYWDSLGLIESRLKLFETYQGIKGSFGLI